MADINSGSSISQWSISHFQCNWTFVWNRNKRMLNVCLP